MIRYIRVLGAALGGAIGLVLAASGDGLFRGSDYAGALLAAWVVGLLMDVGDATVFGQHALAYAVLAYGAEYFRRRVLRFPLWQQAVQVAALLVLCALIVLLVRFVGGAPLPTWQYLVPPLVGALLWPVVSVLLQTPQRPSRSRTRS